jgi:hypothetical protein
VPGTFDIHRPCDTPQALFRSPHDHVYPNGGLGAVTTTITAGGGGAGVPHDDDPSWQQDGAGAPGGPQEPSFGPGADGPAASQQAAAGDNRISTDDGGLGEALVGSAPLGKAGAGLGSVSEGEEGKLPKEGASFGAPAGVAAGASAEVRRGVAASCSARATAQTPGPTARLLSHCHTNGNGCWR